MATAGQTDPRQTLFAYVVARTNLDDEAQTLLRDRLAEVDVALLKTPTAKARARRSMGKLITKLNDTPSRRSATQRTRQADVQLALRDLCPLFPIC